MRKINGHYRHSGTERVLRGKILAEYSSSPVAQVIVDPDNKRTLVFENGKRKKITQAEAFKALRACLASQGRLTALESMRVDSNGVSVKLGGAQKGKRQKFGSRERAEAAINERYDEAPAALAINSERKRLQLPNFQQVLARVRAPYKGRVLKGK